MNPFDLPGSQFLPVFLVFGIAVAIVAVALRRSGEMDDGPRLNLSDPYPIAYLRGGTGEVLRLATVSLADRHFLEVNGEKIRHHGGTPKKGSHTPVESAVLEFFAADSDPTKLFSNESARAAAESYKDRLTDLGLLPDGDARARRLTIFAGAAILLCGTAVYKIDLAFERGRHNIGFLIVLTLIFTVVIYKLCNPMRTQRGERMLKDLKTLFAAAQQKAKSRKSKMDVDETLLVAAVFGTASLATGQHAWVRTVFPRATSSDSSGGSSCGSSGGSDGGGSSCGSSCGGGGGCGGCGS